MLLEKTEREKLRKTSDFRNSNKLWNDLKLNSKKSIGCLMFLIKECKAQSFEEWESYYFESGEKRKCSYIQNKNTYFNEYGRTKEELFEIANKFSQKLNMPVDIVYNYVYIRVIDETWIGYKRELIAYNIISDKCFNNSTESYIFSVSNVDYYKDIDYAVDFEIFKNQELIMAIQLKSTKYMNSDLLAVDEIKSINKEKNKRYTKTYNVQVLYLYINQENSIVNINDLNLLY